MLGEETWNDNSAAQATKPAGVTNKWHGIHIMAPRQSSRHQDIAYDFLAEDRLRSAFDVGPVSLQHLACFTAS